MQHEEDDNQIVVIAESTSRLHRLVGLVAQGDISVLIRGETGAGKELIAEAIHRRSPRASGPFMTLNCAALPESLFEAALFGNERGAFTGASHARGGAVEAAHGGTLFLDEVGEVPLSAQAKLLRVLERREVVRLGGTLARPIDVRFVAATHRDLARMVRDGTFRQDLFFRLEGVSLVVSPLRERREEILPLARVFVQRACARLGREALPISTPAVQLLERHSWPGNVRELRNAIERAVLLANGAPIAPEHLALAPPVSSSPPPPSSSGMFSLDLRRELGDLEQQRILETLQHCGGNQSRAARMLGISRRTLLNRLDQYAVKRPRKG
jgi:two-component system response regulator AtoC